ncbi:hypothetical protein CKO22_10065 [Thiococcus pfennigii]|nr:hypothetical protein [Thiococcus pfennigii]
MLRRMIRTISLLCLLCTAVAAAAGIYRWIDDDGRVTYSDRPAPGAEPVATPIPPDRTRVQPAAASDEAAPSAVTTLEADAGPFEAFEIATPDDGAVVRGDGSLDVGLLLVPALAPGERLRVVVNEVAVRGDQPGTQMRLQGLALGTHRLRAEILDEAGAVLARTATISIHIRPPQPQADGPQDDAGP